jgi:hypothetical protein
MRERPTPTMAADPSTVAVKRAQRGALTTCRMTTRLPITLVVPIVCPLGKDRDEGLGSR